MLTDDNVLEVMPTIVARRVATAQPYQPTSAA